VVQGMARIMRASLMSRTQTPIPGIGFDFPLANRDVDSQSISGKRLAHGQLSTSFAGLHVFGTASFQLAHARERAGSSRSRRRQTILLTSLSIATEAKTVSPT